MNQEKNRLYTFIQWPSNAAVNPQTIARAGFFSTKQGLEVECFACHVKISEWNYGEQVMQKHRTLNPSCPFVLNPSTSGNVPIPIPTHVPSTSINPMRESRALRLASFDNWPASNIVTPESLALAGFYYLKQGDNTQCAFCMGVVRAWEPGDDPDREHQRHFPECPYVVAIINPRIQERNSTNSNSNSQIEKDHFPNVNVVGNEHNLDELGVQAHKGPKKASFATVEARLRSFTGWSEDLIQTPEQLANAGFYYEGTGDQVRCFHCDGGLRHWDPQDDPWTEHAVWFPDCSFLKLVKGQDFITACSLRRSMLTDSERPTIQKSQTTARRRREVTERELQSYLSSPQALAALSIGLNVERVKRAIREKLEQTGRVFSKPDALVEAALSLQHEEEDPSDTNQPSEGPYSYINAVCRSSNEVNSDRELPESSQTSPVEDLPSPTKYAKCEPPEECREVSLEEENRKLKEARLCKICMDVEVGIVFLPCGHLATCVNCAPNLEDCPVCRSTIKATVRTFLS
ncbi:unnamed protein product [Phyllotreta striolata]|uniref:RING-type domain-containing protein n=1 Tax=Phyllotreta striolata TaxID=444603 RepID=A0A9N9TTY7_PHYSR|nr:unnamed protein product [Phyllotreta striolata]